MKLLVDARSLGEKPSGIGIYLYKFVKYLSKKSISIILVTDVCKSEEILELKSNKIPIIELGFKCSKQWKIINYFKFIQTTIHQVKPNIFWEVNNLIPIKIINPYGKIFVTIHDIFPRTHKLYYSRIYSTYFHFALKNTLKIVDGILYNSKDTKENVESTYKEARCIKNFITYIIVNKPGQKIHDVKGYFFYIGNCETRKGTDILILAYQKYLEMGGQRQLYIAGSIREELIQKMIQKTEQNIESFKYLGYLTQKEKEKYLSECSCFIFPSIAEGFGIPILEAMNYERPVIASNLPIFEELVQNNIQYFNIKGNDENKINHLAKKMYEFDSMEYKIDYSRYETICDKFQENMLGEKLLEYWIQEIESEYGKEKNSI